MKLLLAFMLCSTLCLTASAQDYRDDCNDSLDIPSSLNLNGDGMNDQFYIGFACPTEKFSISIFNRWGQEIYVSDDERFKWIGKDKDDKDVPAGVYIYKFSYTFNGGEFSQTGNLNLLR